MPKYVAFEFMSKQIEKLFLKSIHNRSCPLLTIIELPDRKWIYSNSYTFYRLSKVTQSDKLSTLIKSVPPYGFKSIFEENNLYIGGIIEHTDKEVQGYDSYLITWHLK